MGIPVKHLNDKVAEDYELSRDDHSVTLQTHGLKPEVAIMHTGITQSPLRNTAAVQYFVLEKVMPWVWK